MFYLQSVHMVPFTFLPLPPGNLNWSWALMEIDSRNLQEILRVSPVSSVLRCHDWWLARSAAII